MGRYDLINYLLEEGEDGEYGYSESELESMTNEELFDAWLEWHGIIGYTDDIIEVVKGLWNVDLED